MYMRWIMVSHRGLFLYTILPFFNKQEKNVHIYAIIFLVNFQTIKFRYSFVTIW